MIVADASPINFLVRLGVVGTLRATYTAVYLPMAALSELKHSRTPEVVRDWAEHLPAWVFARPLRNPIPARLDGLGSGEREAIALALEEGADTLLADDLQARNSAARLGLKVVGTLGVLRDAAYLGNLDYDAKVKELLTLGFRASARTIDRARPIRS